MVDVHDVEMAGAKAVAVRLEAWGVTSRVATATAETRCRIRLKDIMFGSRLVLLGLRMRGNETVVLG